MKKLYIITAIIFLGLIGAGVLAYLAGNSEDGLFGDDDNNNTSGSYEVGESKFGAVKKPDNWLAGDINGKEDGAGSSLDDPANSGDGTDGGSTDGGSNGGSDNLDPTSPEFSLDPVEKTARDALIDIDFYPGTDYYDYVSVSPDLEYTVSPGAFDIQQGAMFSLTVEIGDGYLDPELTFYGTNQEIQEERSITVDGIVSRQVFVRSGESDTRAITAVIKDGYLYLFNAFYDTANAANYPELYDEWVTNYSFN